MADETFSVELQEKVSGDAPSALLRLQSAMYATIAKSPALTAAMSAADRAINRAGNAAKTASSKLASIGTAAKTFDFGNIASQMGKFGGPAGALGQKFGDLGEGFQKLVGQFGTGKGLAIGASALIANAAIMGATALVALAAAFGAATIAALAYGVAAADAARSQAIELRALALSSDSLKGLSQILPNVTRETGVGREALLGLAKQLDAAGVSATDMPNALRAAAIAEQALGSSGSAKIVEQLKAGKKTAGELANEMKSKFGGVVSDKLLSIGAQTETFKANLGTLFGGLNIEPFLVGLQRLVALFDENTAMGRTLQWTFETLFQPLLDAATASIPVVEAMLLGIAIGALKVYIGLKPAINALKEMGLVDMSGFSALDIAVGVGEALGFVMMTAVTAIVGVVGAAMLLYNAFGSAMGAVRSFGAAIGTAIGTAIQWIQGLDITSMGTDLIMGLVSGITATASAVVDAVKSTLEGAVTAGKAALGISSPSKVFAEMGRQTTAGYVGTVEAGAEQSKTALESMVNPTLAPTTTNNTTNNTTTSNARGPVTINLYAKGGDAKSIAKELAMLLDGDVIQMGGAAA